mgnify:CR=1 FL=1
MRHCGLGESGEAPILVAWEEPLERLKIMSVHPFRKPHRAAQPPLEPYYAAEPVILPAAHLRPLTALEQMYAYWGSDRA